MADPFWNKIIQLRHYKSLAVGREGLPFLTKLTNSSHCHLCTLHKITLVDPTTPFLSLINSTRKTFRKEIMYTIMQLLKSRQTPKQKTSSTVNKRTLSASVCKRNCAMSAERYQSGPYNDRHRPLFILFNP